VLAQPLIEQQRLAEGELPETDWVFFTSLGTVRHFPVERVDLSTKLVAAMGPGTAEALRDKQVEVDFEGPTNEVQQVATAFSHQLGSASVLFPRAEQSLRSIQQHLPPGQVHEYICYRTIPVLHEFTSVPHVMVFTSPSNVYSFSRANNQWPAACVCIGKTTEQALRSAGYRGPLIRSYAFHQRSLADTVAGCM